MNRRKTARGLTKIDRLGLGLDLNHLITFSPTPPGARAGRKPVTLADERRAPGQILFFGRGIFLEPLRRFRPRRPFLP